ncbi:MAG: hypothetical protein ACFFAU_01540 [Candidatus Hodarchaeota archaeon]
MKDLFLAMAILCFIGAIMIYCFNKSVQTLIELRETWKKYKQSQKEIMRTLRGEQ